MTDWMEEGDIFPGLDDDNETNMSIEEAESLVKDLNGWQKFYLMNYLIMTCNGSLQGHDGDFYRPYPDGDGNIGVR